MNEQTRQQKTKEKGGRIYFEQQCHYPGPMLVLNISVVLLPSPPSRSLSMNEASQLAVCPPCQQQNKIQAQHLTIQQKGIGIKRSLLYRQMPEKHVKPITRELKRRYKKCSTGLCQVESARWGYRCSSRTETATTADTNKAGDVQGTLISFCLNFNANNESSSGKWYHFCQYCTHQQTTQTAWSFKPMAWAGKDIRMY